MSADFDEFDNTAGAIPAGGSRKSPKDLPDGTADFLVKSAVLKDPSKQGGIVFQMMLEVKDGPMAGTKIEHSYWLKNNAKESKPSIVQDFAVGQLRNDLRALGFDEAEWNPKTGRKFSSELKRASLVLTGMVVKGEKSTSGQYANLKFTGRGEGDTKPNPVGPAELEAAEKSSAEEIPF